MYRLIEIWEQIHRLTETQKKLGLTISFDELQYAFFISDQPRSEIIKFMKNDKATAEKLWCKWISQEKNGGD